MKKIKNGKKMTFLVMIPVAAMCVYSFAQEKKAGEHEFEDKGLTYISDMQRTFLFKNGSYPDNVGELVDFFRNNPSLIKFDTQDFSDVTMEEVSPRSYRVTYSVTNVRSSGSPVGGAKEKGTKDVIAYSHKFYSAVSNRGLDSGYYVVLRDDFTQQKYDVRSTYYDTQSSSRAILFPMEPSSSFDALSYEEYWRVLREHGYNDENKIADILFDFTAHVKPQFVSQIDLYDLSSSSSSPTKEITMNDVQKSMARLGLETQVKAHSLYELQKSGTSALLFLQDDGRIVTLIAINDDRAVVIDRGITQNVERSVLEKRYSGEALVPTKALTQNAAIVADDAVRELKLPSLDAEVPQQFVLRNTGTTPITLQLEYPLLGVTESKLSRDVIPPGETATLDLKVKWRSILKAPYQNVLVSIATNDPIVPRLQLAILLTPPTTANAK